MHLDKRFAIILSCSMVWGLMVSLFFYRLAAAKRSGGEEKVLVVAAMPLAPGAQIVAASVKTIRVPENLFPHGGFSRVEDVAGRPVISSIQPDEAIVETRIAPRGSGFGVAPMIPSGMRALAVRVNDVAGVAGFVLPGMRVDVLVTGKPPGADDTTTTTALQNVTVLSAGQNVEADGKSQSISVPVVTLLVTPAQAESLALAASEGHIQLVLRNSNDQQLTPTRGRQLRELYARGETREPTPPVERRPQPKRAEASTAPLPVVPVVVAAPPEPAAPSMIVMLGTQKTVEIFQTKAARK